MSSFRMTQRLSYFHSNVKSALDFSFISGSVRWHGGLMCKKVTGAIIIKAPSDRGKTKEELDGGRAFDDFQMFIIATPSI